MGAFAGDPVEWPRVTVIVPGRNEGHLLARTLGSLCAMEYPRFRVVFVDDQSTDDTRAVCGKLAAKYSCLTVIHNVTPPPVGWVGKNWAVHQAESHIRDASGDFILFTDSDLVFHPQCLKQMVRLALHRRCDIASCKLPSLRYETLGELLAILPAMVLIMLTRSLYVANDPRSPKALVAGGFLLVKRTSYEELGGHEAVRGQMIEDIALGMLAKAKGMRVFTAATHDLILARMYEGWRDTFMGLKKNAYAGANYKVWMILPVVLLLLFAGALVIFYPVFGAWVVDYGAVADDAGGAGGGDLCVWVFACDGTAGGGVDWVEIANGVGGVVWIWVLSAGVHYVGGGFLSWGEFGGGEKDGECGGAVAFGCASVGREIITGASRGWWSRGGRARCGRRRWCGGLRFRRGRSCRRRGSRGGGWEGDDEGAAAAGGFDVTLIVGW